MGKNKLKNLKTAVQYHSKFFIYAYAVLLTIIFFITVSYCGAGTWKTDTWFHLMRVQDLTAAARVGRLPDLVNITSFLGIGQSINAMYPPYFLYLLSIFTAMINPLSQWVLIQSLVVFIACVLAMLYLQRAGAKIGITLIFGTVSVISSGLIDYATYGSLGMFVSVAFLPAILIATHNLAINRKWCDALLLAVPSALILNTHLASAAIICVVIILIGLLNTMITRSARVFGMYSISGILVLILSVPSWLMPIVMSGAKMHTVRPVPLMGTPFSQILNRLLNVTQLGLLSSLGAAALLIVPFMMLIFHNWRNGMILYFLGILLLWMSTSSFPWQWVPSIVGTVIQGVEWRLLAIGSTALVCSFFLQYIACQSYFTSRSRAIITTCLLLLFLVPTGLQAQTIARENRAYPFWTPNSGYARQDTRLTSTAFSQPSFYKLRWYTDYVPQPKNKNPQAQWSVPAHKVIIDGKSHRLLPKINSQTHTVSYDFGRPVKGWVDLPFWYYHTLQYKITNSTKLRSSSRGSLEVFLPQKVRRVTITEISSQWYIPAVILMIFAWIICLGTLMFNTFFHRGNLHTLIENFPSRTSHVSE